MARSRRCFRAFLSVPSTPPSSPATSPRIAWPSSSSFGKRCPGLRPTDYALGRPIQRLFWCHAPCHRGVWQAFMLGQPNFFKAALGQSLAGIPRHARGNQLRGHLDAAQDPGAGLIDFDLINSPERKVRLFNRCGQGDVRRDRFLRQLQGENHRRPCHGFRRTASGFPRGAPSTSDLYWDGGCCSQHGYRCHHRAKSARRQAHLHADLVQPCRTRVTQTKTMDEVLVRQQDIQYASRSVQHVRQILERHELRRKLRQERRAKQEAQARCSAQKLRKSPSPRRTRPQDRASSRLIHMRRPDERQTRLEIVHVMYRSPQFEGVRRDTDFAPGFHRAPHRRRLRRHASGHQGQCLGGGLIFQRSITCITSPASPRP